MIHEILATRAVSAFPLSVGTSLALESIFEANSPSIDPERIIPQKVNILDYQEFWLNISTLFRNILGSLPREDSNRVFPGELAEVLEGEIEMIQFITSTQSLNRTTPIFYVSNYQDLDTLYPHAVIRKDTTDNQKRYRGLHNETIQKLLHKMQGAANIHLFQRSITTTHKPVALIMTHMSYDLLARREFKKLDLIESHTGVLKGPALWYTKYQDGKNLPPMPFNSGLLQIFGDKESFGIKDVKLKKAIIDLAKQRRWTSLTTRDKIISDLGTLTNPYFTEVARSMIR